VQLEGFAISEEARAFEIRLRNENITYTATDTRQLSLNDIASNVSEQDLVRWLDRETRKPYVMQTQLQGYLVKMLRHLMADKGFTLTQLVRAKHVLARAISDEIIRLREEAIKQGFQGALFEMVAPPVDKALNFAFQYKPGQYPARNLYQGSYEFQKHYYPMIHDLREKKANGHDAEEFICARALDAHPKVKQWVRNIEKQERLSFWLPVSTGYFYPDFVAELEDGRVLVVEYKGEHLVTADDAREKRQVGEQWESSNQDGCLFLFAVEDDQGRDVIKQINDKIG
jgi:type III restriction enzyme